MSKRPTLGKTGQRWGTGDLAIERLLQVLLSAYAVLQQKHEQDACFLGERSSPITTPSSTSGLIRFSHTNLTRPDEPVGQFAGRHLFRLCWSGSAVLLR